MIVLELDGVKPLTANEVRRWNHRRLSRAVDALKAQLDAAGASWWNRAGWPAIPGPVTVTLQVQTPNRIHRDPDGWYPTLKAALDIVVAHGVLADDCGCHVHRAACEPLPPGDRWLLRLCIDQVDVATSSAAKPARKICNSPRVVRSS